MLVWKVKVAGVLLGAGAVLGFWPIPPLCEQVLEKKKQQEDSPPPITCAAQGCGMLWSNRARASQPGRKD